MSFAAFDGQFDLENKQVDLDAEAQADLAQLPADRPETAGGAAT